MDIEQLKIGDYVQVVESHKIDNHSKGDIGIVKELEPNFSGDLDVYVKFFGVRPEYVTDDSEWFYSKQLEKMTDEEVAEFILINC